jgi:hypothetical protein
MAGLAIRETVPAPRAGAAAGWPGHAGTLATVTTAPPTPGPTLPTPVAKRPLVRHPGRVTTVVLVVGAVITLMIWGLSRAQTETGLTRDAVTLPSAIETLTPGPGEIVSRRDTIVVDLRDDFTGVMIVDPPDGPAFEVPEDQMDRIVPLGQFSWRAGPGQELERFEAGPYRVTALYWPQTGARPASPPAYAWEFRATV